MAIPSVNTLFTADRKCDIVYKATVVCLKPEATEKNSEAWLSLVERCVRDAEAVGSNPVASILQSAENTAKLKASI